MGIKNLLDEKGTKEDKLHEKRKEKKKMRERRKTIASKNTQEFFFTSAKFVVGDKILIFTKTSLGIFSETSALRQLLAKLVLDQKFTFLFMLICCVNIGLIASFDHL